MPRLYNNGMLISEKCIVCSKAKLQLWAVPAHKIACWQVSTCQESYTERMEASTRNTGMWLSSLLVKQEKPGVWLYCLQSSKLVSAIVAGWQEQCAMLRNSYGRVIGKILFPLMGT